MKNNTKKILELKGREQLDCPLTKMETLDIIQGRFVFKHWHTKQGLVYAILGKRKQNPLEQQEFDSVVGKPFIGLNVVLDDETMKGVQNEVFLLDYGNEAGVTLHIFDKEEYQVEKIKWEEDNHNDR